MTERLKNIYSTINQTVDTLLDGHEDHAAVAAALVERAVYIVSTVGPLTGSESAAELKRLRAAIDDEIRLYEEEDELV
jgi:hypothetical protein